MTRAMLYAKRYDKVVAAADKVKELGYSLISNYADVFNGNNSEVILEYVFNYSDNVTHSFDYYYSGRRLHHQGCFRRRFRHADTGDCGVL